MKRKFIRIFIVLTLTVFAASRFWQNGFYFYHITQASSGHFEVEFLGNPISGPIFEVHNMLPGDCETREVIVKNTNSSSLDVRVRSTEEVDNDNLASQISWEIKRGSNTLLSSTLKSFYDDNDGENLGSFGQNGEDHIFFKACFNEMAGNQYQNAQTTFSLVFSTKFGETPSQLPPECNPIKNKVQKFIIGDEGNNNLFGTSKSDFIDGRGGDDKIYGSSADDCIVGGNGKDKIYGGSGNDFILGGADNDEIDGESGEDFIWANDGNDKMWGSSGNDYLNGGNGTDKLDGGSGRDRCINGESLISCELSF